MLSTELYNDLKAFGIPVLYVGDPGQLEPVGDNPNLMLKCDVVLSKIHRQAEQSPIITLAHTIRNGGSFIRQQHDGLYVRDKGYRLDDLRSHDQVICAKNKTRNDLNDRLRINMPGFVDKGLMKGEKLIVLRNNRQHLVFNGLLLFVDEVIGEEMIRPKYGPPKWKCWIINCHDETDFPYRKLPIWQDPFVRELDKGEYPPKEVVHADYGYVITCHKSQGSEWNKVMVIDEWMPPQVWDMKRWRYTAITRAAKELTYCV
jgi:exodeoxyribonuclease-5